MADYLNLDFNAIKQEIKDYIKDNSETLADYNFEGSAISSMINVLSYVTQYNMHYLNMIATELSISTAKKADSIYKLANTLNYLPRRNNAPYVNIDVTNNTLDLKYLQFGTQFYGNNVSLVYLGDSMMIPVGETITAKFYNGELIKKIWLSDGRPFQTYTLPDREKVDDNLLFVGVGDDPTSIVYDWENINISNPIYLGKYYYIDYLDKMKIKFDDGSVYKRPFSEQIVGVNYLKTEGSTYNGNVSSGDEIDTGLSGITAIASSDLIGGENAESLEEIKSRAILMFTTQNRAVTKQDYYTLFQNFPKVSEYQAYSIYGGENVYIDVNGYEVEYNEGDTWADTGFVYFSILKNFENDIYNFQYLTEEEKSEIRQFFIPYKIITIFYKFIEPVIVYMKPKIRLELNSYVGIELNSLEDTINQDIFDLYSGMDRDFNSSNLINWLDGLDVVACCEVDYDLKLLVKKEADISYKVVPIGNKILDINGHFIKATFDGFDIDTNYILNVPISADPADGNYQYKITSTHELEGNNYFSYEPLNGAPLLTTDIIYTISVIDTNEEHVGDLTSIDRVNKLYTDTELSADNLYVDEGATTYTIGSVNPETGFVTFFDMESTLLKFMDLFTINIVLEDDITFDIKRELFLCPEPAEFEYI